MANAVVNLLVYDKCGSIDDNGANYYVYVILMINCWSCYIM